MSSIPSLSAVIQEGFGSAAIKGGRMYRTFTRELLNNDNPSCFIELALNRPSILHERLITSTAGPVVYEVFAGYTLGADPYMGAPLPAINLNALKTPVRPASAVGMRVDPAKVLTLGFRTDLDLVPGSVSAGNRGVGFTNNQDIYFIFGAPSKFLIKITTEAISPPDTDILLKYTWEEILQVSLP